MDFSCSNCSRTLRIPDDKVPMGQVVRIACPGCGNKITIDTRSGEDAQPEQAKAPPPAERDAERRTAEDSDYGDDTSLGFYEEGTKLALVLDSDPARREQIRAAVEEIDYRFVESPETRDAISKMRFHVFDLVILADGYDDQTLEYSPVVNFINNSPMSLRRQTFLSLLGDQFQTMDNMKAFSMSANLVINTGDLDQLTGILKKALAENQRFYKVFMDTLREEGRA